MKVLVVVVILILIPSDFGFVFKGRRERRSREDDNGWEVHRKRQYERYKCRVALWSERAFFVGETECLEGRRGSRFRESRFIDHLQQMVWCE